MQAAGDLAKFRDFGKKILGAAKAYKTFKVPGLDPKAPPPPPPAEPVIFSKPTSSYITEGQKIKIPRYLDCLFHEVELGLVIGKTGSCIPESEAMEYIGGYVLALDMTDFDFVKRAMKNGLPFTLGKAFDTSCPVSSLLSKKDIPDPHNVDLWLKVNGEMEAEGNTRDLVFSIPFLVSFLSEHFTLEKGDLILTGSPGIGPVKSGDIIDCGIGDLLKMTFPVTK